MKRFFQQLFLCSTILLVPARVFADNQGDGEKAARQVFEAGVFQEPIVWVGEVPPIKETEALLAAIQVMRQDGTSAGLRALEEFVVGYPGSRWKPSLEAHLGEYYREHGRYTLALQHWESAWQQTRTATNGTAKGIADFTLVNWTRLLGSLGRAKELEQIFQQTALRPLDQGALQQKFNGTKEGWEIMRSNPGVAYRCGTYALNAVAAALKHDHVGPLLDIPSPESGFSMTDLAGLAERERLPFIAVKRVHGKSLVVPSVVHWKQNHYAAITLQRDNLYFVVDATFERSLWLTEEEINAEASGYFMVTSNSCGSEFVQIAVPETDTIFGKGSPNYIDSNNDQPCNQCPCPPGFNGPGGLGGRGGRPGVGGLGGGDSGTDEIVGDSSASTSSCSTCGSAGQWGGGMPVWRVSEPFMNLWIEDQPVMYRPRKGPAVGFHIFFKQRDEVAQSTNTFGFGPSWNAALLSYVEDTAPGTATMYPLGGGSRTYLPDGSRIEFASNTRLERLTNGSSLTGFRLLYPNGDIDLYAFIVTNLTAPSRVFLSARIDSTGNSNQLVYANSGSTIRLLQIIDAHGFTNSISYVSSNAYSTNLIAALSDPYGRTAQFVYDGNGHLTNITDAVGLSSSFRYDSNGWITNLTTPYGVTSFEFTGGTTNYLGSNVVNRSVLITEPDGAKQLFVYRDKSDFIPNLILPDSSGYDPDAPDSGMPSDPLNEIGYAYLQYRNSWFWNRQQFQALTDSAKTNLSNLTSNDYRIGRMRNWLHTYINPGTNAVGVSSILNMERQAAPDSGGSENGPKVWYGYHGKELGDGDDGTNVSPPEGNVSSPSVIAQVLPNGEARFIWRRFNSIGNVTNAVSSFSKPDGTVGYRTNQFVYAANGMDLLLHVGPNGEVVSSNLFNGYHQVLTNYNAANEMFVYTYDATTHLITSVKSAAGLTTTNRYDSNGFLTNAADIEITRTNSFTYANGQVYTHTDPRGMITTNLYDGLNRLVSTGFPDNTSISNRYDKLDIFGTEDRLGNWTYFTYDSVRRRTAVTNALGNVTTFTYCNCGSLDSTTDALGNTTTNYYDLQGRRIGILFPDGRWFTNRYDLLGRVTNVIDSAGGSTTNWYNNQGLVIAVSNAFGRVQSSIFDIEDRMTNHVSAEGVSIGMAYDDLGRMVRRDYADGTSEGFAYSALGLMRHTNQLSKVTKLGYDTAGRKTAETNANPNLEVTYFTYNAAGDLLTLTDAKSQVTTWTYDSFGRATNKVDAAGNVIFVYRYDANNRLTNRWTPTKTNTFYAYDAVGNLTNVDYTTSHDLSFQYDALNRVTNMVDAVGTSAFGYTSAGALAFEDGPWAASRVSYTYMLGQLTGMSVDRWLENDWEQSYSYDSARRLQSTVSPAGTFTYTYAGAGRMWTNLVLGNGANIANTYDALARLTETRLKNSGGTTLNLHTYTYDAAGRRTNTVRVDGSYVRYKYDDIGQLKAAEGFESGGTSRLHEQMGYAYDAAGNLNYRTNNALVQTFTVNNLNQLSNATRSGTLTVAGTTTSTATNVTVNSLTASCYGDNMFAKDGFAIVVNTNYTAIAQDSYGRTDSTSISVYLPATNNFVYDLNGNLLSDGNRHFSYDDENQLTTVVVTNSTQSGFIYDGKMRRRVRTEALWMNNTWVTNATVRYVYDGNLVVEERDDKNSTSLTFTRGNDLSGTREAAGGIGGLLARTDDLQSGPREHACFHADGNGNVTMLTDSLQITAAKYLYDAFGTCLYAIGPLADANLYRFSSKEFHLASGLVCYLYRYYEPQLQRWITRDRINDPAFAETVFGNVYSSFRNPDYFFVSNKPIDHTDPFGLFAHAPINQIQCADGMEAENFHETLRCFEKWILLPVTYGCGRVVWVALPLFGWKKCTALYRCKDGIWIRQRIYNCTKCGSLGSL